jgi:hypothetical protein
MRMPRLAARHARVALAAATVTALAALTTACQSDDTSAAGNGPRTEASAASRSDDAAAADKGTAERTDDAKGADAAGAAKDTGSDGSGGSGQAGGSQGSKGSEGSQGAQGSKDSGGRADDDRGIYPTCTTDEATIKVTVHTQASGYYRIEAKAKPGQTCYLDPAAPIVFFGSGPEGVAKPVGKAPARLIKLSGSTVAYAGVQPKSTGHNGGIEFTHMLIDIDELDHTDPIEYKLTGGGMHLVDKPVVSHWNTDPTKIIPALL